MAAMERAYGLAAFLIGKFRHAAGIDNNEIGSFAGSGATHTMLGKDTGHGGCLRKIQFTPKGMEQGRACAESAMVNHDSL